MCAQSRPQVHGHDEAGGPGSEDQSEMARLWVIACLALLCSDVGRARLELGLGFGFGFRFSVSVSAFWRCSSSSGRRYRSAEATARATATASQQRKLVKSSATLAQFVFTLGREQKCPRTDQVLAQTQTQNTDSRLSISLAISSIYIFVRVFCVCDHRDRYLD